MPEMKPPESARSELIAVALAMLEEGGHAQLSVRRVAERLGRSSGAPYFHFPNRRALLLALAVEGFNRSEARARAVLDRTDLTPQEALCALAETFLDFCDHRPELVDLMYESELTRPIDPQLEPAYRRAFDLVVEAMARVHPDADTRAPMLRAVGYWTALFGLSRLLRQQLLAPFDAKIDGGWREAILRDIVNAATAPF